jgi:hypothetical protein
MLIDWNWNSIYFIRILYSSFENTKGNYSVPFCSHAARGGMRAKLAGKPRTPPRGLAGPWNPLLKSYYKRTGENSMILHLGERVYWGAPEVIYLEGIITRLDEETQAVLVHIDRATPNSAHLIDTDVSFAADGVTPQQGESPENLTSVYNADSHAANQMSDDEKIRSAAAVAVYQKYGNTITGHQKEAMIKQIAEVLKSDPEMRTRIIASLNQILSRAT